ncbi:MAG: Holliday junction branch migration protein RuvA [bacterium]|nr:Holliday junction branch migration protein RuvA [bacterium]
MLAFLRGTIQAKLADSVIVELHDVGYRVLVPAPVRERMRVGDRVELYTHEVVREDRRELFGCTTQDALQLFLQLISVSGVGPKSALGILSLGEPQDIRDAIAREDVVYLSKVVGIGRKTAERVVIDLRGKMTVSSDALAGVSATGTNGDVVSALEKLGYKAKEVRDIIRRIPHDGTPEERLKAALQELGRG